MHKNQKANSNNRSMHDDYTIESEVVKVFDIGFIKCSER